MVEAVFLRQDPSVVVPDDFSRHSRASEFPQSDIYELLGVAVSEESWTQLPQG